MSLEQSFELQVRGNAVQVEKKQPLIRQTQVFQPPWPPFSWISKEGDLGRGFRFESSSFLAINKRLAPKRSKTPAQLKTKNNTKAK